MYVVYDEITDVEHSFADHIDLVLSNFSQTESRLKVIVNVLSSIEFLIFYL